MKINKVAIISVCLICVIVVATVVYFVVKNDKKEDTNTSSTKPANINEFSDGSLGLSFYITKDFERMGDDTIKKYNPNFIYGFSPKDVDEVNCYISQTKRTSPGEVSQEYLKQGTWEVIEHNNTDAKLLESKKLTIGEVKGISIFFSYTDSGKDMRQIEYVGTNDQLTTFAFCNSPISLYEFYQPKFTQFLDSLKISK